MLMRRYTLITSTLHLIKTSKIISDCFHNNKKITIMSYRLQMLSGSAMKLKETIQGTEYIKISIPMMKLTA